LIVVTHTNCLRIEIPALPMPRDLYPLPFTLYLDDSTVYRAYAGKHAIQDGRKCSEGT
jgi:hypothetical protein